MKVMKTLGMVIVVLMLMSFDVGWKTDFVKAKEKAKVEHKYLLLNFSGSDWCVPCIRTKQEIFDNGSFKAFADSNLVLVNADFPRLKKNKLTAAQTKENEELAEQYNKKGMFPLTLLMDANGRVLKEWIGYPGVAPNQFIEQIKTVECHK